MGCGRVKTTRNINLFADSGPSPAGEGPAQKVPKISHETLAWPIEIAFRNLPTLYRIPNVAKT
jgi:hypothetical protein